MRLFMIGLCCLSSVVFAAEDFDREKRLALEVEDSIVEGDPVWLEQGSHRFLGIYTEAESKPKGDLLILHGRGYHPNWQDFVYPTRTQLPSRGWNTLTIQLPVLNKQATYDDYVPLFDSAASRIQIALDYLQTLNPDSPKIVVAHSCGFHMANHWLGQQYSAPNIAAFIGLGMGPTDTGQTMKEPFYLYKISDIPILDLYAEHDYNKAFRFASLRKAQARHPKSRQTIVKDAHHYYKNTGDRVVGIIGDWLDTLSLSSP